MCACSDGAVSMASMLRTDCGHMPPQHSTQPSDVAERKQPPVGPANGPSRMPTWMLAKELRNLLKTLRVLCHHVPICTSPPPGCIPTTGRGPDSAYVTLQGDQHPIRGESMCCQRFMSAARTPIPCTREDVSYKRKLYNVIIAAVAGRQGVQGPGSGATAATGPKSAGRWHWLYSSAPGDSCGWVWNYRSGTWEVKRTEARIDIIHLQQGAPARGRGRSCADDPWSQGV